MGAESGRVRSRYRALGRAQLGRIPQLARLSAEQLTDLEIAATVLPFRVNDYVLDELIDWHEVPSDPIFQATFPQAEMLDRADYLRVRRMLAAGADHEVMLSAVRAIQMRMNPHPAGQMDLNVPVVDGVPIEGCQHKYRETVLFFPRSGQTCHAYCTYCFRWPQFVGIERLRFAASDVGRVVAYLRRHTEVTNVLVTGGDPLVMSSSMLRRHVEPLLGPGLDHLTSIRIGTKALSFWPYRFTTDSDADDLLRLFEQVQASGRQLALMAHYTHPRELATEVARHALRRVRNTGAVLRCQSPLIRHVNDRPEVLAELWREEVRLGAVPYYLFVARNTGPRSYFELPLAECLRIFSDAYVRVSGLARTVRGPVMSTSPGKALMVGVGAVNGERVFVLKLIQGRDPEWVNRVFFARFDASATWLDQLEPAFGARRFFFEGSPREITLRDWISDRAGWASRLLADRAAAEWCASDETPSGDRSRPGQLLHLSST